MALIRSNLQLYGVLSTVVFLATVLNAFRQRSNFYAAAVYLSKSSACTMVLWNQGIYLTTLFGKLLQAIFFGDLRAHEVERLQERGWFAVTETLLALTIFREEFDTYFILFFVSLLFLKVFHWLIADRIEIMEQSPDISRLFHTRITGLLIILWAADVCFLAFAAQSLLLEGPSVMIMFASEYMILVATIWSTTMKYGINIVDLRSDDVWEEKSMSVFYVDLATDFFKLITYLTFFGLILTFYGLPLNILRDVYITLRSFITKLRDLRRFRRATNNMNELYPDASREEMTNMVDRTCIICREDMEYRGPPEVPAAGEEGEAVPVQPAAPRGGPNDTPKKLPCGHVFHFHCLRSWLERQQSCPTCRRPVLPSEQVRRPNRPGVVMDGRVVDGEQVHQARVDLARNLGREGFAIVFPGIDFPPEADLPAPRIPPAAIAPAPAAAAGANGPALLPNPLANPVVNPLDAYLAGAENPLVRFSMPNLRAPPAGEAGLYTQPDVLSGYAGVAYGASHAPNIGGRRLAASRATATMPRTSNTPAPTHVASSSALRPPTAGPSTTSPAVKEDPPASSSTATDEPVPLSSTSSFNFIESLVGCYSEVEQAQATVERLKSTPPDPLAPLAGLDLAEIRLRKAYSRLAQALDTESQRIKLASGEMGEVKPQEEEAKEKVDSPSLADTTTKATGFPIITRPDPPARARLAFSPDSAYPRLIPLFDPASPYSTVTFPHLLARLPPTLQGPTSAFPRQLPTTDLFSANTTGVIPGEQEEELAEIGKLTKGLLESKLRTVMRYQLEMERLAKEMKSEVEGITLPPAAPSSSANEKGSEVVEAAAEVIEKGSEVVEKVEGKGKAPMEGIHAVGPSVEKQV